eukprot:NODE_53_length_30760_cov_1.203712.p4 type:complete len:765 gc:universal NODE_53_length_30760_cov_1.203712:15690-13396(-)
MKQDHLEEQIPLLSPPIVPPIDTGFQIQNLPKVGTFRGVFLPCICSIIGFILFTRFGYVIGETGVFNTLVLTILACTSISMTVLSTSAILTNSSSDSKNIYTIVTNTLGREFGSALGISFYLANIFGLAFYVTGLTETFVFVLGRKHSSTFPAILPVSPIFDYIYSTIILALTCITAIIGNKYYDKSLIFIFFTQCTTIFIILVSFLVQKQNMKIDFTGFSLHTLKQNMFSDYTNDQNNNVVTFQSIFSILYPAVTGFQCVESINDNLKYPHRNIPTGALSSTLFICIIYTFFTLFIGATFKRTTLVNNYYFLLDISILPRIVFFGMLSSTFSSIVSTMQGASNMLNHYFNPIHSILITWFICQVLLLTPLDLNTSSTFVSLFYLLADVSVNLSCLLCTLSSSPNFRPLFKFYNKYTASIGLLFSLCSMIYIHPLFSAILICTFIGCIVVLKSNKVQAVADSTVNDALLYHQIRKYLLRLKPATVQYWRPQILMVLSNLHLNNTPDSVFKEVHTHHSLIQFANDLKKSGLFILCVAVDNLENYEQQLKDIESWMEVLQVKVFTKLVKMDYLKSIVPVTTTSGLGGMSPNTVMIEYPQSDQYEEMTDIIYTLYHLHVHLMFVKHMHLLQPKQQRVISIWPLFEVDTFIYQMGCILGYSHGWKYAQIRIHVLVFDKPEEERNKMKDKLVQLRIEGQVIIHQIFCENWNQLDKFGQNKHINNIIKNSKPVDIMMISMNGNFEEMDDLIDGIERPLVLMRGASKVISD